MAFSSRFAFWQQKAKDEEAPPLPKKLAVIAPPSNFIKKAVQAKQGEQAQGERPFSPNSPNEMPQPAYPSPSSPTPKHGPGGDLTNGDACHRPLMHERTNGNADAPVTNGEAPPTPDGVAETSISNAATEELKSRSFRFFRRAVRPQPPDEKHERQIVKTEGTNRSKMDVPPCPEEVLSRVGEIPSKPSSCLAVNLRPGSQKVGGGRPKGTAASTPTTADPISQGLTSLMTRVKTREARPRSRRHERRELHNAKVTPENGTTAESHVVIKEDLDPSKTSDKEPAQPDRALSEAESAGSEKPSEDQTATGQPVEGATDQQPEIVALTEPPKPEEEDDYYAWYEADRVWLVQKEGLIPATELRPDEGTPEMPPGRLKLKLDERGLVLDVDEEDIEKANPPHLDQVEDLASLLYLNESSVLHTLRTRLSTGNPCTLAGPHHVSVGPPSYKSSSADESASDAASWHREPPPSDVCTVARRAYLQMLASQQEQAITFLGPSGAGKTSASRRVVEHLVKLTGSSGKLPSTCGLRSRQGQDCGKVMFAKKLNAAFTVLESFGNAETILNRNASRLAQILSLGYDSLGRMASASFQAMLLDQTRVAYRPPGEGTFHVFYELLAGAESSLRTELYMNTFSDTNFFGIGVLKKPEEKQQAAVRFSQLQSAMAILGISADEQRAIWFVLAAIFHLGAAGATKVGRKQFAKHEYAQKAAYLLGCSLDELSTFIFKHHLQLRERSLDPGKGPGKGLTSAGLWMEEMENTPGLKLTALERLQGMASGLYMEILHLILSLINRSFGSMPQALTSILIVDAPGFQQPRFVSLHERTDSNTQVSNNLTSPVHGSTTETRAGTFADLCQNYVQDRLQLLSHECSVESEYERYLEENVDVEFDVEKSASAASIPAVDDNSQAAMVLPLSLRPAEGDRGLLWLLEETAHMVGGTEKDILDKLTASFGARDGQKAAEAVIQKSETPLRFSLAHGSGPSRVEYNMEGWTSNGKQNLSVQNAGTLLRNSQKLLLASLFSQHPGVHMTSLSRAVAGVDGSSRLALRRTAGVRRSLNTTSVGERQKPPTAIVKLQADFLIETLKRTEVHFMHCYLARQSEMCCPRRDGVGQSSQETDVTSGIPKMDVSFLRAQLKATQLLQILRIHRQGFPDCMTFTQFRQYFDILAPHLSKKHGRFYIVTDEKRATEDILEALDLDKSRFAVGTSQVMFRAGVLSKLKAQREKEISKRVINFQAICRGYLSRQRHRKRTVQEMAIRCLQKNFKLMENVCSWHWWRVLTYVRPLITSTIPEKEQSPREEELVQMRSRFEKSERERQELRRSNEQLEGKVSELQSELGDERSGADTIAHLLSSEVSEKMRLEKELKELHAKFDTAKRQMEVKELEASESRLLRAAEFNGSLDGDSGGEWKAKYERGMRENEYGRKRLQQEYDDHLEAEKRQQLQLERKVTEVQATAEEAQRNVQLLQRKCQRLSSELQDTRLHMEGQQSRSYELEKKQKKFDSELTQALEEAETAMFEKEMVLRERDGMMIDIVMLKENLEEKDIELASLRDKVDLFEAEMREASEHGAEGDAAAPGLHARLYNLQTSIKEQEEELDEQAAKIQTLEQNKLRYEMEMERMRQIHKKDFENKEDEAEDVRQSCQKRLRHLEDQLEEQHETKQKLILQKHDLEGKLMLLGEQVGQRDFEKEKQLRRDLRRTKALLADAQSMLQHLKENAPSRREISELKNQLEESEFACAAAVKARQVVEAELTDLHYQLEEVTRSKAALEEQMLRMQRDGQELQNRLDGDQEDLNELMKKHKALVAHSSSDLAQINELQAQLDETAREKEEQVEKIQVLGSRISFLEDSLVDRSIVSRQEGRIRDLESKLEFEKMQIRRFEALVLRLKEAIDRVSAEREQRTASEIREKEQNKRQQRQLNSLLEETSQLARREGEATRKRHELELDMASLEAANQSLQSDLRAAFQRIGDLQAAIEDEMASDENDEAVERVQELVVKFQKKKNKTDHSESDSEVEDRVDNVKSWLSKSRGSSGDSPLGKKTPSDDSSSMYSAKYTANNNDLTESRPASVLSSLSYRKRGGTQAGDDSRSLLSSLSKERDAAIDSELPPWRQKRASSLDYLDEEKPWNRSQSACVSPVSNISTSFRNMNKGSAAVEKRWRAPVVDSDEEKSTFSSTYTSSLRRQPLDLDTSHSMGSRTLSSHLDNEMSSRYLNPDLRSTTPSRLSPTTSLSQSARFDSSTPSWERNKDGTARTQLRSFSVPPQPNKMDDKQNGIEDYEKDVDEIKPVTHRSWLDPDLEAAISEVLKYKPVKPKRRPFSLVPEGASDAEDNNDGRRSVSSLRSLQPHTADETRSAQIRRSYSDMDMTASQTARLKDGKVKVSECSDSSTSSSSSDDLDEKSRHGSSRSGKKKKNTSKSQSTLKKDSKKKKKKKKEDYSSDSSSSSSSSTYKSMDSVKLGPRKKETGDHDVEEDGAGKDDDRRKRKKNKKRQKQVDSVMMKYLYRPESD
uniref:unconventional myosin-XVIIIa-like isoform X2 n=1 Tax=Myxine glutinosa TaxID=7769 RepID=UPI00358E40BE